MKKFTLSKVAGLQLKISLKQSLFFKDFEKKFLNTHLQEHLGKVQWLLLKVSINWLTEFSKY